MKGFIEVNGKYEAKGKILLAIHDITRVCPADETETRIVTKSWALFVSETYEEIKQKIQEAQGE